MPHATMPPLQQVAPTIMERAQHERRAQPTRHHPPEEGNEQAGGSGLQLGGKSMSHAPFCPGTLQPKQLIIRAKPSTQHMTMPVRDPPLGDGHEQAKHVVGQAQPDLPIKSKHKNPTDRKMLQKNENAFTILHAGMENIWTSTQRLAQIAQHHPLEDGSEQAGSNSRQVRCESTPHATFGPGTMQHIQPITKAKPRLLHKIWPECEQATQEMGQQQPGLTMENQQKKIPAHHTLQQKHPNAPTILWPTHDPSTDARTSPQDRTRAARDRPLGEGHEQPEAATEEQGICKTQPRPGEERNPLQSSVYGNSSTK